MSARGQRWPSPQGSCAVAVALASAALLFFRTEAPLTAGAARLASGTPPSPSPSPSEGPEPTPPPEEPPDAGADSFAPAGAWRVHREETPWQYAVYTLKPGHKLSYHYRPDQEAGDFEGEWSCDKYNRVPTFRGKPGKDGFARHYLRISRKENGYYWVFHSTLGASMMKPEP